MSKLAMILQMRVKSEEIQVNYPTFKVASSWINCSFKSLTSFLCLLSRSTSKAEAVIFSFASFSSTFSCVEVAGRDGRDGRDGERAGG